MRAEKSLKYCIYLISALTTDYESRLYSETFMKNSLVKHSLPKKRKRILEHLLQYLQSYMHNGNLLRLYTKSLRLTTCLHQRLLINTSLFDLEMPNTFNPMPYHAVNKKNYHVVTRYSCCAFNPPVSSQAFHENFIKDVNL